MAFSYTNTKGKTYFLHGTARTSKSGKTTMLYYFKGAEEGALDIDSVPEGRQVVETDTGMLVLKKAE